MGVVRPHAYWLCMGSGIQVGTYCATTNNQLYQFGLAVMYVSLFLIHSPRDCWFDSRTCTLFFRQLRGLTLNVESDWSVVMFTATGHNNQPIRFKVCLICMLQPQ